MNQKAYVICATYGEWDDNTSIPMFVCNIEIERDLFLEALYKRESPYYDKVVNYFHKEYPDRPIESCVPEDISWEWKEVDVLTICEQHHNTI